jgi:hypothetical protein
LAYLCNIRIRDAQSAEIDSRPRRQAPNDRFELLVAHHQKCMDSIAIRFHDHPSFSSLADSICRAPIGVKKLPQKQDFFPEA